MGHLWYKQPPFFKIFNSYITKLIQLGIEIWYAGGIVGLYVDNLG